MSDDDEKPPPLPVGPIGVYKCKEIIHDIFLQTGQKDLLMTHIRLRGTQNGWTWTMRDEFIDYIKKRGKNNVNVSHMVADLAPLGRELFPNELRNELVEAMYDVIKDYFTIDDTVTPLTDPDNPNSEAEKTFLFQSRDVKPDPGLGVGVEIPDSPPPSPPCSPSGETSSPRASPGPGSGGSVCSASSSASGGSGGAENSKTAIVNPMPRQQNSSPRQSPGPASSKQGQGSVVNTNVASAAGGAASAAAIRPMTPQQPPQPPPVLRAEAASSSNNATSQNKVEPLLQAPEEDEEEEEEEEEEQDDEDDEEDARNNDEDEEDELMDV